MADRELRLRVGAAIDASFTSVMASIVEQSKRARKQIEADVVASARTTVSAQRQATKEINQSVGDWSKVAKAAHKDEVTVAKQAKKEVADSMRDEAKIHKEVVREMTKDQREYNREKARLARDNLRIFKEVSREQEALGKGGGGLSRSDALIMRAGGSALRFGARMAGSLAHGFGLDPTLSGQLQGAVSREKLAIDVATQGYIGSGKGPEGSKEMIDPSVLTAEAHRVGNATGTETNTVLEGLEKFVKMTGDLKTARESVEEIGKVAKANGADLGDMMEAAANVSIAMGDIPNKAEHLAQLMKTVAGQGHLGAVAIKDLANQMGKLTGQANFFKIDPRSQKTLENAGVTNEVTQRVAIMGAMAQYARAKGGRITAQQATQASMAFIRDLSNATEVKRMHEHGINVYADEGHTKVRDPLQVMLEVFKKAQVKGGIDRQALVRLFPNQQSRALANALSQDYNAEYKKAVERGITDETERHQEAMKGVTEAFQNYLRVTQSNIEVDQKFNMAMKSTESQTKILNNEFGKLADQLKTDLYPAFHDLAQLVLQGSHAFADWYANFFNNKAGGDSAKQSTDADVVGLQAVQVANRVVKEAANAPDVVDMLHGGMTKQKVKMSDEEEGAIRAAEENLKQEVEKRKKELATSNANNIFGGGTNEEVQKAANAGSFEAQQLIHERNQFDHLRQTLDKLSDALKSIDSLKGAGRVETVPVAIVADHTATPPGAQPHTDATMPEDSSSHQ